MNSGHKHTKEFSFFHKLNPLTNLVILICIIILLFFLPVPFFSLVLLIIVFGLYLLSSINFQFIIRRARFLLYFGIFIFLIQLLFTPGEGVLLYLIPKSSPIFPGALQITTAGLNLGLSMTLRFLVIVLSSFWFISITDPNKLASSLMHLGLPYRYGFMLVTSLRFLPQFEMESNTVRNAQLTRGIKLQKQGIKNMYDHVKFTLRPLIFSALQKAEILARSMEGRGFGLYNSRTFIDKAVLSKKDVALITFMISITVFIIISFTFIYDQVEIVENIVSFIIMFFD